MLARDRDNVTLLREGDCIRILCITTDAARYGTPHRMRNEVVAELHVDRLRPSPATMYPLVTQLVDFITYEPLRYSETKAQQRPRRGRQQQRKTTGNGQSEEKSHAPRKVRVVGHRDTILCCFCPEHCSYDPVSDWHRRYEWYHYLLYSGPKPEERHHLQSQCRISDTIRSVRYLQYIRLCQHVSCGGDSDGEVSSTDTR